MDVTAFKPNYKAEGSKIDIPSEVIAAIFARYSRNGEGMKDILNILERTPMEEFDDAVWKWLDFGHASIGGLTGGIPVGVDKVSMLLPYLSFFLQSKQDGQETSTRYVEFKPEGLEHPSAFGIPERFHSEWYDIMMEGFNITRELTERLDQLGKRSPELANIPSNANEKKRARMIKNFGFDRARYTLPVAALTNFGQIMTAREWAQVVQYLDSFDLPCSKDLAGLLREDIFDIVPRLMKHSFASERTLSFANDFLDRGAEYLLRNGVNTSRVLDEVSVQVYGPTRSKFIHPELSDEQLLSLSFEGKKNRYDFPKGLAEKIFISTLWNNMSIAEARDINRQRPCKKDTLLAPVGSYMPDISIEEMKREGEVLHSKYQRFLDRRAKLVTSILHSENPRAYVGCLFLGDQTPFELHTTGDHFAYVTELRTGAGVHFRYDDHMRQAYAELSKQRPALAKHILLGTGEPE